jgi:hypothetical protein
VVHFDHHGGLQGHGWSAGHGLDVQSHDDSPPHGKRNVPMSRQLTTEIPGGWLAGPPFQW